MKNINKGSDYKAFLQIKDSDGSYRDITGFESYKLELRDNSDELIRTLELDNTVEEGKLFLYDNFTLKYYLETRDTDNNSVISVWFLAQENDTELSDGVFNIKVLTEVFKIS